MSITKTKHVPQIADENQSPLDERIPNQPELSVSQTAEILKMSERHLNDLLDNGTIAFCVEGHNRMVLRESMVAFEKERERGFAILTEITRDAQEMGLYDMDYESYEKRRC